MRVPIGTPDLSIQADVYLAMYKKGWMRIAVQHEEKWLMVDGPRGNTRQWTWINEMAGNAKLRIVDDQYETINDYRDEADRVEVHGMSAQGSAVIEALVERMLT
jgi:hypothetical protein